MGYSERNDDKVLREEDRTTNDVLGAEAAEGGGAQNKQKRVCGDVLQPIYLRSSEIRTFISVRDMMWAWLMWHVFIESGFLNKRGLFLKRKSFHLTYSKGYCTPRRQFVIEKQSRAGCSPFGRPRNKLSIRKYKT